MSKFRLFIALAIVVPSLAAGALWWRHHANEEARWSDIAAQVPSIPSTASSTNAVAKSEWWFGSFIGMYEVGQVVLRDGDVWRFAFASHHAFTGPDSYTVFRSHRGKIRVRGGGFYCEVEFYEQKQPADTQEFVALLRRQGDDVEILR
jgi:hypothetical protein